MSITFGEAKKALAQYAGRGGRCATADDVPLFVYQVLQYMLFSGQYGNLRKFCFCAHKGCITVPYELEVPLKVRIDGAIGDVWSKWFEWHSGQDLDRCLPADDALFEEPDYYPIVYDLPPGGARVGVLGICNEAEDAYLIVQGLDTTGREVFVFHKEQQISGEYLKIEKGKIHYTKTVFSKITHVTKSKTNGYTPLYWEIPERNLRGFLADYSPVEEKPSYRRFKLTSPRCGNIAKVSVIGRIRLKPVYSDNDIIPFDNWYALSLAGQTMNANANNDTASAAAKDKQLENVISKENEYKRVNNGQVVDVMFETSAGSIKNIVG